MKDFEKVRTVKTSVQGKLLLLPGVHAVGIGEKVTAGARSGETSVRVYVVKKKALSELPAEGVIPPEIQGVKTDVIESEVFRFASEDNKQYRPVVGGCEMTVGGFTPNVIMGNPSASVQGGGLGGTGTIGCFAKTGTANPKVVGLTCWHVVGSPPSPGLDITLQPSVDGSVIKLSGTNTPGSIVGTQLGVQGKAYETFYATKNSDSLPDVAVAIASRITSLQIPGISAGPAQSTVKVTGLQAGDTIKSTSYSAHRKNNWSDFVTVANGDVISSIGRAMRDCAAYINFNAGGTGATSGVFVPIAAGDNSAKIIEKIGNAINNAKLPGSSPNTFITANPPVNSANITIVGAQETECEVSSDVRVGQPTNTMCAALACINDRVGVVLDAHVAVDAALIALDSGTKYRADILDLGGAGVAGSVMGTFDVHTLSTGDPLKKRGYRTGLQRGTMGSLDMWGFGLDAMDTDNNPPHWSLLARFYTGAFSIEGAGFADGGDSGSAILNDSNQVGGMLFAISSAHTLASPIKAVIDSFPDLHLSIETAPHAGVDKVAP
jgi:hypothetical protein